MIQNWRRDVNADERLCLRSSRLERASTDLSRGKEITISNIGIGDCPYFISRFGSRKEEERTAEENTCFKCSFTSVLFQRCCPDVSTQCKFVLTAELFVSRGSNAL